MFVYAERTLVAINKSAANTHDMFTRSYGLVYKRNMEPISDFYRGLYAFVEESTERERAVEPSRRVEQIFSNMRDFIRRTILAIFADYIQSTTFVSCMIPLMQRTAAQTSSSDPNADWLGEEAGKLEKMAVRTLGGARSILVSFSRLHNVLDTLEKNVSVLVLQLFNQTCRHARLAAFSLFILLDLAYIVCLRITYCSDSIALLTLMFSPG